MYPGNGQPFTYLQNNLEKELVLANRSSESKPKRYYYYYKPTENTKYSTYSLNRNVITRSNKDLAGKVVKKHAATLRNHPKLSREEIEKEFYEYTLECRRRLDELFQNSPSSDTPQSSSEPSDFIETVSTSSPIKLKPLSLTPLYSNNFKILRNLSDKKYSSKIKTNPTAEKKKTEEIVEQVWRI